ncbi:hypothetical protein C2G38_2130242 [Gigaspora rosea]|uniref:Uncharacterized protein n=1 Tax=Gigaspora rosea TaxID=44941 RepID=A0A397TPX5_9GLOM|nr:hypothetical protein C2G38_2130242 [Gigaspora rosea]
MNRIFIFILLTMHSLVNCNPFYYPCTNISSDYRNVATLNVNWTPWPSPENPFFNFYTEIPDQNGFLTNSFTFLDYSIYTTDGEWGFTTTFYDTPPGLGKETFLG